MKTKSFFVAGMMCMNFLMGCGQHEKPNTIYMSEMVYSPALKAQQPGVNPPVKGTVPRGFTPYNPGITDAIEAGKLLRNPLIKNEATLQRGQKMYNTYCLVCHGPYGEGDGTVVPKFARPPSLQSDKIINFADGGIYHIISNGQNRMPSYASQILQNDRWAIVHYIRALHRAKHPSQDDLKADVE